MKSAIILRTDTGREVRIETANGFVSRCTSPVFYENYHDAERCAEILNRFFANGGTLEEIDAALMKEKAAE
ncbi:MAG: hypothetical protein AB7F96_22725 [Beijerinckiaceae bacterium]